MKSEITEADRFYSHACGVVEKMAADIETGCPPTLARAFAVFELGSWHHACRPVAGPWCADRKKLRIAQAVQLAISYWNGRRTGTEEDQRFAREMTIEYMRLLTELGGQ